MVESGEWRGRGEEGERVGEGIGLEVHVLYRLHPIIMVVYREALWFNILERYVWALNAP